MTMIFSVLKILEYIDNIGFHKIVHQILIIV